MIQGLFNNLKKQQLFFKKYISVLKTIDTSLPPKWNLLGGGFYSNRQRSSVVLVRRCRTCCPRRSGALREIRFPPPGAIPILSPSHTPPTLCCWHSHANLSPLVITLPLNQLTTTAGVRLLTAHTVGWMGGGMRVNVCVCLCACLLQYVLACICWGRSYFGSPFAP